GKRATKQGPVLGSSFSVTCAVVPAAYATSRPRTTTETRRSASSTPCSASTIRLMPPGGVAVRSAYRHTDPLGFIFHPRFAVGSYFPAEARAAAITPVPASASTMPRPDVFAMSATAVANGRAITPFSRKRSSVGGGLMRDSVRLGASRSLGSHGGPSATANSLNDVTCTVNVFAVGLQHGVAPQSCAAHGLVIAVPFWKICRNDSAIVVPSMIPFPSESGQLNVSVTGLLNVTP